MPLLLRSLCLAALSLLAIHAAQAADQAAKDQSHEDAGNGKSSEGFNYVLGLRAAYQPEFMGARDYKSSARPIISLQWGKFRLSSSGASAVMGFGREVQGSGASTDLLSLDRIKLSLSLRFDGGRNSNDSPRLAGLPDVRRTLRAQLSSRYSLSDDLSLGATWSSDLLGRGGGSVAGLGLGYRLYRDGKTEWTTGGGIGWGSQRYQQAYFGVAPEVAPRTLYSAYQPGSGLRDAFVGLGWTYAITHHWIAFSSASVGRLIGPSADSPLVERRSAGQIAFGLAYRSR
ncbi:MipA/OmpV family protein [Pelomonas sp. SE-A7]|uniref:MipA/OmpV family protein n=1 Tax=Pelomonas sp. SE-A7 TaxID=3054953 RepID=UPI00259CB5B2|nr:MipA/OmpV family protein [Pelomonas sp. SE-A7]MDM4765298.1 MipA/OmpV family protein [Pelomonas sp. SE-A7]